MSHKQKNDYLIQIFNLEYLLSIGLISDRIFYIEFNNLLGGAL